MNEHGCKAVVKIRIIHCALIVAFQMKYTYCQQKRHLKEQQQQCKPRKSIIASVENKAVRLKPRNGMCRCKMEIYELFKRQHKKVIFA